MRGYVSPCLYVLIRNLQQLAPIKGTNPRRKERRLPTTSFLRGKLLVVKTSGGCITSIIPTFQFFQAKRNRYSVAFFWWYICTLFPAPGCDSSRKTPVEGHLWSAIVLGGGDMKTWCVVITWQIEFLFGKNHPKHDFLIPKFLANRHQFAFCICLAILCDLFGVVKWPFKWSSDLQLWVTWCIYVSI